MIEISQLAQKFEELLNNKNTDDFTLDKFIPNVKFKFNICLNSGKYKKAETSGNGVTYYINAIMKALSSDVEGLAEVAGTYNATMSTSIEFLIPFPEKERFYKDANQNECVEKFSDAVHYWISSKLQAGLSEEMTDDKGNTYLVGSRFSIPSPGSKEIRSMTGESLPLTIYSTHYFVAQGVNSSKIKLQICTGKDENDNDVYCEVYNSRIGIARRSITDGNIFNGVSASKNTLSGTALTISFDAPLRKGNHNDIIGDYLLGDDNGIVKIKLHLPHKVHKEKDESGKEKEIDDYDDYTMIIADAGMNGEMGLAASINVRLIEYYEVKNA